MYKKPKKKKAAVPNLPEEILLEIFARLPATYLSQLRCVSKSLGKVISRSDFTNMHLNHLRRKPIIVFASTESKTMCSIDYDSISSLLPTSTSSAIRNCNKFTNRMDYPLIPNSCEEFFLCSCDSWFCILTENKDMYLWNPFAKVYKRIPQYSLYGETITGCVYGLGYNHKIGNYKLVRIDSRRYITHSRVDVYTLGSNSWKSLRKIPYCFNHTENNGQPLNGSIHWFMSTIGGQNSRVLVSFDIVNEIFKEVALPEEPIPHPEECLNHNQIQIDVGALGGCLCLMFHVVNVRLDVWVMKEYGVRESWIRSFTVTEKNIIRNPYLKLIWSFKNNEILL